MVGLEKEDWRDWLRHRAYLCEGESCYPERGVAALREICGGFLEEYPLPKDLPESEDEWSLHAGRRLCETVLFELDREENRRRVVDSDRRIDMSSAKLEHLESHLALLVAQGEDDRAADLLREIKLLRPYLEKGLTQGEAAARYYADHPEVG